MQRIRIRYTKEGRVRFTSARDLGSVWERALRRADLPIAYSEGFHPHPKVSFPDALPVGYASTAEYAELTFASPIEPGLELERLSATLPDGMTITTFQEVRSGAPKLARLLRATLWEWLLAPLEPEAAARQIHDLRRECGRFLASDRALVVRPRPTGDRTIDVRAGVLALRPLLWQDDAGATIRLRSVLRNDGPTIRPTDLHRALAQPPVQPGDPAPGVGEPVLYRRVAQGEYTDDGVREALSEELVPLQPERLAGAA